MGDDKVPLGRISSSRGVTAGARSTRGVTAITMSTWRLLRVGDEKRLSQEPARYREDLAVR